MNQNIWSDLLNCFIDFLCRRNIDTDERDAIWQCMLGGGVQIQNGDCTFGVFLCQSSSSCRTNEAGAACDEDILEDGYFCSH